jgi:hypothetical protein
VNFLPQWAPLRTDGVRQTISVTRLHLPVEYGPFRETGSRWSCFATSARTRGQLV